MANAHHPLRVINHSPHHVVASPKDSNATPTSHTATPTTVTAVSGSGVGPVTAESCTGKDPNQQMSACGTRALRTTSPAATVGAAA